MKIFTQHHRADVEHHGRAAHVLLLAIALALGGAVTGAAVADVAGDCGTGADAPGNPYEAALIDAPVSNCQGTTGGNDGLDWYRFAAEVGDTIVVDAREGGAPYSGAVCLYRPSADPWAGDGGHHVDCGWGLSDGRAEFTADETGDWRVVVNPWSGDSAYTLTVSLEQQVVEDTLVVANPADARAGVAAYRVLGPPGVVPHPGVDGHWIRLDEVATGVQTVELTWTRPPAGVHPDLDVRFFNAELEPLAEEGPCASPAGSEWCTAPSDATWAAVTGSFGANVDFTFTYLY